MMSSGKVALLSIGAGGLLCLSAALLIMSCSDDNGSEASASGGATSTGGDGDGDSPASSGGGGTQDGVGGSSDPNDCQIPTIEAPQPVQVEVASELDMPTPGGEVVAGVYRLVRAVTTDEAREGESMVMRFALDSSGGGIYSRQLGLRVVSSRVSWSAAEEKFTYQTLCPDTDETRTFTYSQGMDGALSLLDSDTMLFFSPE